MQLETDHEPLKSTWEQATSLQEQATSLQNPVEVGGRDDLGLYKLSRKKAEAHLTRQTHGSVVNIPYPIP